MTEDRITQSTKSTGVLNTNNWKIEVDLSDMRFNIWVYFLFNVWLWRLAWFTSGHGFILVDAAAK